MKISIITVCLNTEDTIAETISSVKEQLYHDIEHIIVDGGSKDLTVDIIKSTAKENSIIVSEQDGGIYDAMNKGINLSSGNVIGFLNAGDIFFAKDVIDKIANRMSQGSVDACWGDLCYVAKDDPARIIRFWKSSNYIPGSFSKGWVPPHPCFYARKEIYDVFGVFDLQYPLAADFEIMSRFLSKHNINTVYIPEVFVRMRLGGATNANIGNILTQNIEIFKSMLKNGIRPSPFFVFNKFIEKVKQFMQVTEQVCGKEKM